MATMLRFCLLAVVSILVVMATQHLQFVRGDEALISQLCGKTQSPAYCQRCLAGKVNQTAIELGAVALKCAADAAGFLVQELAQCVFNETNPPSAREACGGCVLPIHLGEQDLLTAIDNYNKIPRSDSVLFVRQAIGGYDICAKALGPGPFPEPLPTALRNFQGYAQSALGVLLQLG